MSAAIPAASSRWWRSASAARLWIAYLSEFCFIALCAIAAALWMSGSSLKRMLTGTGVAGIAAATTRLAPLDPWASSVTVRAILKAAAFGGGGGAERTVRRSSSESGASPSTTVTVAARERTGGCGCAGCGCAGRGCAGRVCAGGGARFVGATARGRVGQVGGSWAPDDNTNDDLSSEAALWGTVGLLRPLGCCARWVAAAFFVSPTGAACFAADFVCACGAASPVGLLRSLAVATPLCGTCLTDSFVGGIALATGEAAPRVAAPRVAAMVSEATIDAWTGPRADAPTGCRVGRATCCGRRCGGAALSVTEIGVAEAVGAERLSSFGAAEAGDGRSAATIGERDDDDGDDGDGGGGGGGGGSGGAVSATAIGGDGGGGGSATAIGDGGGSATAIGGGGGGAVSATAIGCGGGFSVGESAQAIRGGGGGGWAASSAVGAVATSCAGETKSGATATMTEA